jgi:hypothetical protein
MRTHPLQTALEDLAVRAVHCAIGETDDDADTVISCADFCHEYLDGLDYAALSERAQRAIRDALAYAIEEARDPRNHDGCGRFEYSVDGPIHVVERTLYQSDLAVAAE